MNLYLLTQSTVTGYDTYDSAVVAAESEDNARKIHPSSYTTREQWEKEEYSSGNWPTYNDREVIKVRYLGTTDEPEGIILSSFNAG